MIGDTWERSSSYKWICNHSYRSCILTYTYGWGFITFYNHGIILREKIRKVVQCRSSSQWNLPWGVRTRQKLTGTPLGVSGEFGKKTYFYPQLQPQDAPSTTPSTKHWTQRLRGLPSGRCKGIDQALVLCLRKDGDSNGIGKNWEDECHLVMTNIAMENHHAII